MPIKTPIILKGTAPDGMLQFNDKQAAETAIFPILSTDKGQLPVLVGTGFYISYNGLFVTAAHSILHAYDEHHRPIPGRTLSIVQRHGDGSYGIRPIHKCYFRFDLPDDIVVGQAYSVTRNETGEEVMTSFLSLEVREISPGEPIACYGYPASTAFWHGTNPAFSSWPTFYNGQIIEKLTEDRYQTDMYIHGGASGAPVFGRNGKVIGINRSSFGDEENLSFITPIRQILGITLPAVKLPSIIEPKDITIAELANLGLIGITKG